MPETRVLIVIPCLNEEATLGALIEQLMAGSPDATVVVADGGSSDRSRAIAAAFGAQIPKVFLLDNPKRLQSAGINLAVERFGDDFEWLVRVDAHCRYPDGYAGLLVDAAARQDAQSVVVPMETRGTSCFQRAAAAAQNSRAGTGGSAHRHVGAGGYVDHGHHALMSIAAFRAVGGYDERFSHNEDAELDARLIKAGHRIWLEPSAALVYAPRRSITALFRQYRGYGRGRAQTIAKHALKPRLRQRLPLAVAPAVAVALVAAPGALAVPAIGLLALPAVVWALACSAVGAALAIRRADPCLLLTGPALMTMHLAWSLGYLSERLTVPRRNGR